LTSVWTHVAATYSSTNGLGLFVNGSQYGFATGGFSYTTGNTPMVLTLGSRELNATEISTLANP